MKKEFLKKMHNKLLQAILRDSEKSLKRTVFLAVFLIISLYSFASYYTVWSEYPSNPVLDPASGVRAYYPSVLYDSTQFSGHGASAYYKMWFAQDNGIAMAYSNDGISWTEYNSSNPLSGLPAGANHPVVLYNSGGFGGGSYYYKIWYWTGVVSSVTDIRYAESVDGVNWVNDQPIQQHATDTALQLIAGYAPYNHYFYHMYGPGSVLYNGSATNTGSATPDDKSDDQPMTYRYVMYYDTSSEGTSPEGSQEQTSLAYSTNGIYWIRYGDQPVLIPSGNTSEWDGWYRYRSCVIRVGSAYHLWFSGANGDSSVGTSYAHGIGHASSSDGLNWTVDADNPAMHTTDGIAWRSVRSYTSSVLYDSARFSSHGDAYPYKMWYTGRDASGNTTIGYAWLTAPATAPSACFSANPASGYAQLNVSFNAGCSTDSDGTITNYSWDFGDGRTGNGMSASHTFTTAGQYTITLTVMDNDGLTDAAYRTITVENPLVACFSASQVSGFVPFTSDFDASCSQSNSSGAIVFYKWYVNGNYIAEGITSSYTFNDEGDYTVTLEITDEYGNVQTTTKTITGELLYPPAVISLTREINRSLARAEAYHTIKWAPDPNNSNYPVERYNIYRKNRSTQSDSYKLLSSTNSNTYQFMDIKLPINVVYSYYLTTVLTNGAESAPSAILENQL